MKIQRETEIIVRCYVVSAFKLRPKNQTGSSDPYIRIDLGKSIINDRSSYILNQTSPVFGKTYELNASLPRSLALKC